MMVKSGMEVVEDCTFFNKKSLILRVTEELKDVNVVAGGIFIHRHNVWYRVNVGVDSGNKKCGCINNGQLGYILGQPVR